MGTVNSNTNKHGIFARRFSSKRNARRRFVPIAHKIRDSQRGLSFFPRRGLNIQMGCPLLLPSAFSRKRKRSQSSRAASSLLRPHRGPSHKGPRTSCRMIRQRILLHFRLAPFSTFTILPPLVSSVPLSKETSSLSLSLSLSLLIF